VTLLAPFAAIEARLAQQTSAMLSNVVVYPDAAPIFVAEFDAIDGDALDMLQMADMRIEYLASAADLSEGALLTINSVRYQVVGLPQRIGPHMMRAQLAEVRE
jgi:hypothetical protein